MLDGLPALVAPATSATLRRRVSITGSREACPWSTGDGRNGEVRSVDGVLDELLAVPKEMGGPGGDRTNPEQLSAAGCAACFHTTV